MKISGNSEKYGNCQKGGVSRNKGFFLGNVGAPFTARNGKNTDPGFNLNSLSL